MSDFAAKTIFPSASRRPRVLHTIRHGKGVPVRRGVVQRSRQTLSHSPRHGAADAAA